MGWLKNLLGWTDRATVAGARISDALEGLASDIEMMRAGVRGVLGIDASEWAEAVAVAPATLPCLPSALLPSAPVDTDKFDAVATATAPANGKKRSRK